MLLFFTLGSNVRTLYANKDLVFDKAKCFFCNHWSDNNQIIQSNFNLKFTCVVHVTMKRNDIFHPRL